MPRKIGWCFPPTNGGRVDGFNDPGIAHFDGNPLVSLARETIQNSLDAKAGSGPVEMSFEIQEVARVDSLGREELAAAIDACLREIEDDDDKARGMLRRASELLQRDRLPYLRVSDRNTTGLRHGHWKALVKLQGASVKEKRSAGGSHGIGKYAPFAVSSLRTVFYWTQFEENGESQELFQGKAVLMSHEEPGRVGTETQGTGFFGIVDGCRELTGDDIPECICRVERDAGRGNGTSLWIAGFRTGDDWQSGIAKSVISNFFYAIEHGMLSVSIEQNARMRDLDLQEIDKTTIFEWFGHLAPTVPAGQSRSDEGDAVMEAHEFWHVTRSSHPTAEKEDADLGHCRLWVRVSEGLPSKVGFVRQTGMLITTQQPGLMRFRGLNDFIAVCVFESDRGNELLRKMENPQHDRFEPDRLPENERRRGKRALARITSWIREEVSKCAAPPSEGETTDLNELAQYLPDLQPDDEFDAPDRKGGERGFSGPNVIRLKPRVMAVKTLPLEAPEAANDGGGVDDVEDGGGGGERRGNGGGGGGGDGDGTRRGEGEGNRGGRSGPETVAISDVRLVPMHGDENRYRVSFLAGSGGRVRLELGEAGDSAAMERRDVQAFGVDGKPLNLDGVELREGERTAIEITGVDPIGERAWRVRAVRQVR